MKEVYPQEQMFRLGGDEFVVVFCSSDYEMFAPQIVQVMFQHKLDQLKQLTKERQITLAIGAAWKKKPGTQLMSLLAEAERLMYEDKAEFYRITEIARRT